MLVADVKMKKCESCGIKKLLTEFRIKEVNAEGVSTRQDRCIMCQCAVSPLAEQDKAKNVRR